MNSLSRLRLAPVPTHTWPRPNTVKDSSHDRIYKAVLRRNCLLHYSFTASGVAAMVMQGVKNWHPGSLPFFGDPYTQLLCHDRSEVKAQKAKQPWSCRISLVYNIFHFYV